MPNQKENPYSEPHEAQATEVPFPLARILIGALVFALVANLFGPGLFWNVGPSDAAIYFAFIAVGGLVAEVCLLAIWAALGSQPIVTRLPLALSLLVVATCAYLLGLQLPKEGMPLEVAVVLGVAAVVMFSAVQLPLLVARARDHKRIAPRDSDNLTPEQERAQFGLRYLLGWTGAICVLLVVVRYSLPSTTFSNNVAPDIPDILIGMLLFVALSALICLPCVHLALDEKLSVGAIVWLVSVCLVGPPSVLAGLTMMFGAPPDSGEMLLIIYSFAGGLAGTTLLVLFGIRTFGFRLVRAVRAGPAPKGARP